MKRLVRGWEPWEPEEDALLISERDKGGSFEAISTTFRLRTGAACKSRYSKLMYEQQHGKRQIPAPAPRADALHRATMAMFAREGCKRGLTTIEAALEILHGPAAVANYRSMAA